MADDMATPDDWSEPEMAPLHVLAGRHDHKGHSEEMCVRCGWVMGHRPLNCMNDDTPHVFPSQQAEIERLRENNEYLHDVIASLRGEVRELEAALPDPPPQHTPVRSTPLTVQPPKENHHG